jgi:hypothetical protein
MLEPLLLFTLAALFFTGYATRSYVGVLVPGVIFAVTLRGYLQRTETGDEMDVLAAAFLVWGTLCVAVYLGGVSLGRRWQRAD